MKLFMVISDDKRSDDVRDWKGDKDIEIISQVEDCEAIGVAGGDGTLLPTIQRYHKLQKPFIPMNRGTVGFVLNPISDFHDLATVLANYPDGVRAIKLKMMKVTFVLRDGSFVERLSFNDAYMKSDSGFFRGNVYGDKYPRREIAGDGVIVATTQGSTAYTRSANGPILPLGHPIFAITTICSSTFHIGACVDFQKITVETDGKYDGIGYADCFTIGNVGKMIVEPSDVEVTLLYRNDYDFESYRYLPIHELNPKGVLR